MVGLGNEEYQNGWISLGDRIGHRIAQKFAIIKSGHRPFLLGAENVGHNLNNSSDCWDHWGSPHAQAGQRHSAPARWVICYRAKMLNHWRALIQYIAKKLAARFGAAGKRGGLLWVAACGKSASHIKYLAAGTPQGTSQITTKPASPPGTANKFHGRKTSNGELFDMNNLTGAHPTLPIPSYVRVTNLSNQRTLILRLNDRGPYTHNRILDLSRKAAELLDTLKPRAPGVFGYNISVQRRLTAICRESGHILPDNHGLAANIRAKRLNAHGIRDLDLAVPK